jgi:DNA-binding transcriptional LysR family regulator
MPDWEDFRLFSVLAGATTLRAAASRAGISHSTLSRRMETLEASVGASLFSRGPRGFELTEEGTRLQAAIARAADAFDGGLRDIAGAELNMKGVIRVTLPDFVAYYGLLDQMASFQATYPEIDFEVDVSYDTADLNRREADIAIRLVEIGQTPADTLFGRKVWQSHACGYASKAYLAAHDLNDPSGGAVWLGWAPKSHQDWVASTPYPLLPARGSYNHAELQHQAARAGLGLSYLPISIGDADPDLLRLPKMVPRPARDIWVLTHADLKNTERLKVFRHWIGEAIRQGNF